ncbi:hypothetical protein PLIIFM63780_005950 [Purpureocillium lilacinum]|nr:hypothetical protein PLIIFM63780_005950 [Purpureocillium lilacinum]
MPKRRARSPIRLVDVVFLAGTASGTVFSLSNFQMLSGGSVPLNCILAYNTPIRGCRIRDFTEKTCSEECRDSLNEVQNNVQASCDLISASEGTLLSKAQKGTLTDSLCRPEDVSTSIAPTPTPETTIRSFSIIPSETPPPPESTSESSTISSVPSTSEPESTPLSTSTSKIKSTHIYATVVIDDKRVGFGKVNIDDNNPAAEADDPTRKRGWEPI